MIQFFTKRSALYRMLFLDLVIVFSIIILTIPLYARILSSARLNAISDYKIRAERAAEQINATVANLLNNVTNLNMDQDILKLSFYESGATNYAIYYTITKAQKLISASFFAYDNIDEAVLLFRRNPIAITSRRSFMDRKEFYENFIAWRDDRANDTENELTADFQHVRLLPSQSIMLYGDHSVNERTGFLLPVGQGGSMLLCVFFNTEALVQSFGVHDAGDGAFLVMKDLQGNKIVSTNTPTDWETAGQYERIEQPISAFKSSIVLGIPDAYFSQLIAPQRNLILMYSMIIGLVGLLIASTIAYHSVLPIRKLIAGLHLKTEKDKYEYSIIEDAFHNLNQSLDHLVEETELLERSLRQSRFGQVLFRSSFSISHKHDFITALPKLSAIHCVAVVCIDYSGKQTDEGANDLIFARITQSLSVFEPIYPLNNSLLAILIHSDETEQLVERINIINERLNTTLGAYVTAGISQPDMDINTTARQFIQAMDNLSRVTDEKTVVTEHMQNMLVECSPLFEAMRRIYDLLLTGAREQITEQLNSTYADMKAGIVTSQHKKQLYYCIEMMLSSARLEHGLTDEEFPMPPYDEACSLAELFQSFEQAMVSLCSDLSKRRMSGNTELKERILTYIDQNYHNPDLYANVIADACKISVKYLHRIFREYTGRSVCDYIEDRRMQQARELLKDDHVNISIISDACGFRSLNTFYKAFKRNNGVSPTDYRKLIIDNQPQSS